MSSAADAGSPPPKTAMPVHSREKKESNHEDMEVDFPEQDGSSTDEEDTVSSSVSEDGDSSGKTASNSDLQPD